MTSTPVKDVGMFRSGPASLGGTPKQASGPLFESVLSGQTKRETSKAPAESQSGAVKKTPGESLKAREDHQNRVAGRKAGQGQELEETGEISQAQMEEAMEVLGAAAAELMQQITETLGVTPGELEQAMDRLGMDALDVLDESQLSALLLDVTGAQDAYALLTDGQLYDSYQELMGQLQSLLGQAQEQLQMTPEQMQEAIGQMDGPVSPEEAPPAVTVQVQGQAAQEDVDAEEEPGTAKELTQPSEAAEGRETAQVQTVSEQEQARQQEGEAPRDGERKEAGEHRDHSPVLTAGQTDAAKTLFQPQAQQAAQAESAWRTDTQDIMRQILDYMRIQVRPGESSLEMQLHPESLGSLHIQIASKGGVVTANFIAQNETVKAALESQMIQLRESFEQQGVKVEAIQVTVQAHAFEQNLEQGRGRGNGEGQTPRRARTRRIDLNAPLETESLEEEDRLAAEMMAANGSQVDYTA